MGDADFAQYLAKLLPADVTFTDYPAKIAQEIAAGTLWCA